VFLSRDVVGQIPVPADGDPEGGHGSDAFALSIIVPFYNPGPRFRAHLSEIVDVLTSFGRSFEVIAVSDGSTDGSQNQVASVDPRVRLISLPSNRGKGAALRIGMAEARGTYVGFIDADGDLPADLIPSLVVLAEHDGADVVLGSKRHPGSVVIYPPLRRAYSMIYQLLVLVLFNLPVRDTQTGLKLIRRQVMLDVVPRMVEKRFAFDLELLVVASRLGYRRFIEVPVVIGERFSSTVSLRTVRGMVQDTLAIFYRLRIMRWYDHAPHPSRSRSTARTVTETGVVPMRVPSLPTELPVGCSATTPTREVGYELEGVAL
jgi:glycosyltransferase involved in cell wall biosynthesis